MSQFDITMRELMRLIPNHKKERARIYLMKLLKTPQIYDENIKSTSRIDYSIGARAHNGYGNPAWIG